MKWSELKNSLKKDFLSRKLKNPSIRINALNKIERFILFKHYGLINNIEFLFPESKDEFKESYSNFKTKSLNGAEENVVNEIYRHIGIIINIKHKQAKSDQTKQEEFKYIPISGNNTPKLEIEKDLISGNFNRISSIEKEQLEHTGFYCIRLRENSILPLRYHQYIRTNRLLYIGKAEKQTLYKRFLNQELKARGHGTFFRSIGAVLGYRPEKGSLSNKQNKNNYTFKQTDKKDIIKWLDENVEVNWIIHNGDFFEENILIKEHLPLLNSQYNPKKLRELDEDKTECRTIARYKA